MPVSKLKAARNARLANLLASSGRGDRTAFQELYVQSSPQLFAVVNRILKREDLSEEVLQDTYIKIWEAAGSYQRDKAAPMTWMIRVARNRAIDLYRRLGRERPLESEEMPEAPKSLRPDQLAARREQLGHIDKCLDELTDNQSRSVRLAYLDGLTYAEASKRLGSPANTVKSWVRRGLHGLRECLDR